MTCFSTAYPEISMESYRFPSLAVAWVCWNHCLIRHGWRMDSFRFSRKLSLPVTRGVPLFPCCLASRKTRKDWCAPADHWDAWTPPDDLIEWLPQIVPNGNRPCSTLLMLQNVLVGLQGFVSVNGCFPGSPPDCRQTSRHPFRVSNFLDRSFLLSVAT